MHQLHSLVLLPIQSITYHSILQQVRQHHHNSTLSVVNKLPHVPSGGLHGTLSYDVRLLLLIALYYCKRCVGA